ncbi:VIR protein [Plasmodium vivax]|uniref:VIR protein n=1 Tax=Plasmodium vivax TaxID=5855 RepID=A0A1G4H7Q9_PLAVI|nr:VIR protein [Plasmodium vivax]
MHDLCEDIAYIINEKTKIHKNSDCKDIISRVSERREKLRKVYHTNQYHSVFDFDKKCTIDYIMNKFSGNECEIVDKPPNAMEPTDNILNQQTEQVPDPDPDPEAEPEQEDDVDLSVTEVTDLEMDLQLPPVEEPKLDTTYAAASLCGVSLIGAMIYKFKPFGFGSRAPGMRNGMGGYPLPHAANGDYFMDNFEYLQTSIPNNEYHLGYGPAADH